MAAGYLLQALEDGASGRDGMPLVREEPETSKQQYDHLRQCWGRAFNGTVPLAHEQVFRRGNRRLHDREVCAVTRSGRKLVWDLGRGIEAVMIVASAVSWR
ncbi:MAG: hypothetical protein N2423_05865 [Novosphingobium sp.]|nr:hypothetical protein [Novosphingobium sp.]